MILHTPFTLSRIPLKQDYGLLCLAEIVSVLHLDSWNYKDKATNAVTKSQQFDRDIINVNDPRIQVLKTFFIKTLCLINKYKAFLFVYET